MSADIVHRGAEMPRHTGDEVVHEELRRHLLPTDAAVLTDLLGPLQRVRKQLVEVAGTLGRVSTRLQDEIEDTVDVAWSRALAPVANSIHEAAHALADPALLAPRDLPVRLQVALVGRTEAGKSTLVNALLGRSAATVGEGRQRTTRGQSMYRLTSRVDLIDTPGVAASGGHEDELIAASAVAAADMAVYLVNSDQFGGDEANAARRILEPLNTPIVLALNIKHDIDGRRAGRVRIAEADRRRFLNHPSEEFNSDAIRAHADRVAEATPAIWQRAGAKLHPLHALAGSMSSDPVFSAEATGLREASRVPDLVSGFDRIDRTWLAALRVTRLVEPLVVGALDATGCLRNVARQIEGLRGEQRSRRLGKEAEVETTIERHARLFADEVDRELDPLRRDIVGLVAEQGSRKAIHQLQRDLEASNLDEVMDVRVHALAQELERILGHAVPVDDQIEWHVPYIRFQGSVDMEDVFAEALLGSAEKAARRRGSHIAAAVLKRLGKAAIKGASGGPKGIILTVISDIVSFGFDVRRLHRGADERRRAELRSLLYSTLDELRESLRTSLRGALSRGDIGRAVEAHVQHLELREDRLASLGSEMEDLQASTVELRRELSNLEVRSVSSVVGSRRLQGFTCDRVGVHALNIRGATIPLAALAALQHLAGIRAEVVETMETA